MIKKTLGLLGVLCLFSQIAHSATNLPVESLDFVETFDEANPFETGKWVLSTKSKYLGQPVKVMAAGDDVLGFENDKGVQLTQEMKHYGFGAKMATPIKIGGGKDLLVQYELKFIDTLNCGGAYVKLLRGDESLSVLDNSSPYTIMFGPDRCGGTNKVHFIVQHRNPVSNKWEEKHFNETIHVKSDKKTHLYSLILRADNTFTILVDNKLAREGSLLTHMTPAINPPSEIDDPTDFKPADWVDNAEIPDPEATKPEDWDENQPRKIPDPAATKPDSWLDDAPQTIPNPEIERPEDWDDEEDGEWEAPSIPNPVCEQVGCGPWSPPMIDNPLFKGKWTPPMIPNPAFKGVWAPKKIPNPEYFVDNSPVDSLAPINALAVEVWTTNAGIHFDNFVVAHSEDAVKAFTAATYVPKAAAETVHEKKTQKDNRTLERQRLLETGDLTEKANVVVSMLVEYFVETPVALAATILSVLLPLFYLLFFSGKSKATKVAVKVPDEQEPAKEEEPQAAPATTDADADADAAKEATKDQ